ncbi:MAG: ribonuclease P protein component 4 [Candidatus Nanohaloarchaea archaeon]
MKPREIAEERIRRLFDLAEEKFSEGRKELADRYVELARRTGMRHQVSIPREFRHRFCSSCGAFLVPGENCTVRIDSKNATVNYLCEDCGEVERHGFKN